MRLATVEQSQEIDQLSCKVYGLTSEVLMEAAGCSAAREITQSFFPELSRGKLVVVCGPGNNGADGLVVARHLHSAGYRDLTVLLDTETMTGELAQIQLNRVELQGVKWVDLSQNRDRAEEIKSASLIVDALFGIGLSRPVEGHELKLIDLINSSKGKVVSLDTPSGLDCDRGIALGGVIRADMTLSFGLAKPGFFVSEGPFHVGTLRVLPIGFPYEALRGVATSHFLFNEKLARRYLPARKDLTNKSDYGRLLVVAGQEGMWGAGILSSSSAYRMGCGYVIWSSFVSPPLSAEDSPEVLTAKLNDELLADDRLTAAVVGPGLGVGEKTAQLIQALKQKKIPVVIDADAITTAVQYELFPFPENWVLTPHAGELSRILKIEAKHIENDRFAAALKASELTGCHVLLKGYRSVLAYQKRCMVIHAGNSALAKAGTGDVLSGMIGSLLAQGVDSLQATSTAAYIHGRMADEWIRIGKDKRSMNASDLRDHLPNLVSRISGGTLV